MDKFAVDIEKVLDEFEYNEGREEPVTSVVIKDHSLSHLTPKPIRPPAASYRRAPFEPINLADADFSAAPIPPPGLLLGSRTNHEEILHTTSKADFFERSSSVIDSELKAISDIIVQDSPVKESVVEIESDLAASDDTPDLLDSKTLLPVVESDDTDSSKQLPDITSVRSSISCEENFDLIKPHLAEPLPPVLSVSSHFTQADDIPPLQVEEPISSFQDFVSQDNTDEDDVEQYLKQLDDLDDLIAIENNNFTNLNQTSKSEDKSQNSDESDFQNTENSLEEEEEEEPTAEVNIPLEDIPTDMGLTGSSNNKSDSKTNSKTPDGDTASDSADSRRRSELLQEFPSEETAYSSTHKRNDLDNINSRSCTNHSSDSEKYVGVASSEEPSTSSSLNEVSPFDDDSSLKSDVIDCIVSSDEGKIERGISSDGDQFESAEASALEVESTSQLTDGVDSSPALATEGGLGTDPGSSHPSERSVESTEDQGLTPPPRPTSLQLAVNGNQSSPEQTPTSNTVRRQHWNSEYLVSSEDERWLETGKGCAESWTDLVRSQGAAASWIETMAGGSMSHLRDQMNQESEGDSGGGGRGGGGRMSGDEIGKLPPLWIPDSETDSCMQCQLKFTMIRRRHHCRACGLVLCSKCCNLKAPLEFLEFMEARVCQPCFNIIYRVSLEEGGGGEGGGGGSGESRAQPNPNNPMEYCSTIPPLQQAGAGGPPPPVMVPSGVLKREGKSKSEVPKQVIFSDGIRPGGDLTELDEGPAEPRLIPRKPSRRLTSPTGSSKSMKGGGGLLPPPRPLDPITQSFIPSGGGAAGGSGAVGGSSLLPPLGSLIDGEFTFFDDVTSVGSEPVKFALNYNLFVSVKRVKLECCVGRDCWSICSEGLACLGQDEVVLVLEAASEELLPPVDVFHLINHLHLEAAKGSTVTEMSFTPSFRPELLDSRDHGGFLYIRPTFQCTNRLLLPAQPYLIAILIHRWETPWARLFPLRLVLRLGAEYRYYPCPLVSLRHRPPLYTDIGHTVMKILVDFRKYSYTLATVRGLVIHMEDRQTTILFPRNRYDQVIRALNNSNESVLALGANLSTSADSHLVCIQGTKDESSYHTQAINIHNKPRRVTGASFVVFNGALKSSGSGLAGKSSIMEDGLMVQISSDRMVELRTALREMRDFAIACGPCQEETVLLQWTADDLNFNIGVVSCIDGKPLDGIPSIRVHNGTDYSAGSKLIRWTEVFILQTEEGGGGGGGGRGGDPLDISRVSETLARASCVALLPELESLARANLTTLAVRSNIHPDNVGYETGSEGRRLPDRYMRRLDSELVPVLHQAALSAPDSPASLELIFRIMHHP